MIISESELKHDLEYYISLVEHQDIIIMRDGRHIAKLINAQNDRSHIVRSLRGILSADANLDDVKGQKYKDL